VFKIALMILNFVLQLQLVLFYQVMHKFACYLD